MEKKVFTVVIERDEEGWLVADVPELNGCHTQAKTMDELIKRVKEVIELCLEDLEEKKEAIPKSEFVGIQRVKV
jgi:predicted RNase H-like HicB family nuclease